MDDQEQINTMLSGVHFDHNEDSHPNFFLDDSSHDMEEHRSDY
jgi:hypothetical protein